MFEITFILKCWRFCCRCFSTLIQWVLRWSLSCQFKLKCICVYLFVVSLHLCVSCSAVALWPSLSWVAMPWGNRLPSTSASLLDWCWQYMWQVECQVNQNIRVITNISDWGSSELSTLYQLCPLWSFWCRRRLAFSFYWVGSLWFPCWVDENKFNLIN